MSDASNATALFPLVCAAMGADSSAIRCSKAVLAYLSHLLEDLLVRHRVPGLVCVGFQEARFWYEEEARYQEIGGTGKQVWVFVRGDAAAMVLTGVEQIWCGDGSPLGREWFVLFFCPPLAVALCARDCALPFEEDNARQFDVCWSFDRAVVEQALDRLAATVERERPERLVAFGALREGLDRAPLAPEQAAPLTAELAHFKEQLETTRAVLQRITIVPRYMPSGSVMLAHDLRTQVQSLVIALDLLESSGVVQEGGKKTLQAAQGSAAQLTGLVQLLFDANALEAQPFPVVWEALNMGRLATDAVASLHPALAVVGITLTLQIDEQYVIWGDRLLASRVLQNLVSNAMRFTGQGGRIAITAYRDGAGVLSLRVSDTGSGIAPERLARLFERNPFDGPPSLARVGIGLLFCRLAMEAQGGSIEVASAPGVGTTVTLTFRTEPV